MITRDSKLIQSCPLDNRSQSALEYMMTYGWAILIIVIVALILYTMGIFSPSSSSQPFTYLGSTEVPITNVAANSTFMQVTLSNQYGFTIHLVNVTISVDGSTYTAVCTKADIVPVESVKCNISSSGIPFQNSNGQISGRDAVTFSSTGVSSGTLKATGTFTTQETTLQFGKMTTFIALALPPGITWAVTYANTTMSSSSDVISFPSSAIGNFSFNVSSPQYTLDGQCGKTLSPSPLTGHVVIGKSRNITFSDVCNSTFFEQGLPIGHTWNVTYNGVTKQEKTFGYLFTVNDSSINSAQAYIFNLTLSAYPNGGKEAYNFSIPQNGITISAPTPNGKYILLSSPSYENLSLLNITSNLVVAHKKLTYSIYSIVFTNNSKYAYLGTSASYIIFFNLTSFSIIKNISSGSSPQMVVLSPDGKYVYASSEGSNNITIINTSSNTNIANVSLSKSSYVYGVTLNPNGTILYALDFYNGYENLTTLNATAPYNIEHNYVHFLPQNYYTQGFIESNYISSPDQFFTSSNGSYIYVAANWEGGGSCCAANFYKISTSSYTQLGGTGIQDIGEGAVLPSYKIAYFGYGSSQSASGLAVLNLTNPSWQINLVTPFVPRAVSFMNQSFIKFTTSSASYTYSIPTLVNSTAGCSTIWTPSVSSGNLQAGYSTSVNFVKSNNCTTTVFTESGLPVSTEWTATYNGLRKSSNTNAISFQTGLGSLSFSVNASSIVNISQPLCNSTYVPTPSSGSNTAGSPLSVSFSLTTVSCTTTFVEHGLPIGHTWNVTYDGVTKQEKAVNLLLLPNDTSFNLANNSVFNVTSNTQAYNFSIPQKSITFSATSPNGKFVLLEGNQNLSLLNTTSNSIISYKKIPFNVYSAAFTDNSKYAYLGTGNNFVVFFNVTSMSVIKNISASCTYLVTLSNNGRYLYGNSQCSNNITVINTTSNTNIKNVSLSAGSRIFQVALNPNDTKLYVMSYNYNNVINLTIVNATNPYNVELNDVRPASISVWYPTYEFPGQFWVSDNGSYLYLVPYWFDCCSATLYKLSASSFSILSQAGMDPPSEGSHTNNQAFFATYGIYSFFYDVNLMNMYPGVYNTRMKTYALALLNQSFIKFTTSSSSYSFSIATLSNSSGGHTTTYTPSPTSGSLQAGYSLLVNFVHSYV